MKIFTSTRVGTEKARKAGWAFDPVEDKPEPVRLVRQEIDSLLARCAAQ